MTEIKSNHYVKHNVSFKEYKIHKYVYNLNIVHIPKIISYDKKTKILTLARIHNLSISDSYGELLTDVPTDIISKIRDIIKTLLNHGIMYIDITGYNFIEHNNIIWIIDFEHATYVANHLERENNKYYFIYDFIQGVDYWNPDFL